MKQESIPVGGIPSAAVVICLGGVCLGRGVCPGGYLPGGVVCPGGVWQTSPMDRTMLQMVRMLLGKVELLNTCLAEVQQFLVH